MHISILYLSAHFFYITKCLLCNLLTVLSISHGNFAFTLIKYFIEAIASSSKHSQVYVSFPFTMETEKNTKIASVELNKYCSDPI